VKPVRAAAAGILLACAAGAAWLLLLVPAAGRPAGAGERESPLRPPAEAIRPVPFRGFADDFTRSPGHGLKGWRVVSGEWRITFSFDPNRIPRQYGLEARAEKGTEAVLLADEPPWSGVEMEVNLFPLGKGGSCGVVLGYGEDTHAPLRVLLADPGENAVCVVRTPRRSWSRRIGDRFEPGQWHALRVTWWAWILGVTLDGKEVLALEIPVEKGAVGLCVEGGSAEFDDVRVRNIPWTADRAGGIPWRPAPGSRWCRVHPAGGGEPFLRGYAGALTLASSPLPLREVCVRESPGARGSYRLSFSGGLDPGRRWGTSRVFRVVSRPADFLLALSVPPGGPAELRDIALRFGKDAPEYAVVGSYAFSSPVVPDPSDYLDFTPEEVEAMKRSGKWEVYRRKPKTLPVVGRDAAKAVWIVRSGTWRVRKGRLEGAGPRAVLLHAREVTGPCRLRLRVRAKEPGSTGWVRLYGGGDAEGVRVGFVPGASPRVTAVGVEPGAWRKVEIRCSCDSFEIFSGGKKVGRGRYRFGGGGEISLGVDTGRILFDDVEIAVPRRTAAGRTYLFDRREADWRRTGGRWVDHAGIACILSSRWISLLAPRGEGMLWNKHFFGPDVTVSFDVEENSEWFGWNRHPSHVHYPYDNIRVAISPRTALKEGYLVEINARNRTATVLFRAGKEAVVVPQGPRFPIRYRGGHAPYYPRRSRITLMKRGGRLRLFVNGVKVLEYTDPKPLPAARVGIGGYNTRCNFSRVEIRTRWAEP